MEVARYFHDTADSFDALYNDGDGVKSRVNRIFRKGLYDRVLLSVRELKEMGNPTVLDVGCGSGRNSVIFVQAGAAHVTGVDFSDRMLELADETVRTHGVADRCTFLKADFLEYDPDEAYDASVALGVFDYVKDPGPFLRRMVALTRGKVIGSFPGNAPVRSLQRRIRYNLRGCPLYFYSREKLERTCEQAGLTDYRIVPYASSGFLLVGQGHAS